MVRCDQLSLCVDDPVGTNLGRAKMLSVFFFDHRVRTIRSVPSRFDVINSRFCVPRIFSTSVDPSSKHGPVFAMWPLGKQDRVCAMSALRVPPISFPRVYLVAHIGSHLFEASRQQYLGFVASFYTSMFDSPYRGEKSLSILTPWLGQPYGGKRGCR